MSATDLRPPRETPNLGLPVPGDAAAADAPTDIGNLADAIDRLVEEGVVGERAGDLKMTARTVVPGGWLYCDGRLVDRTVFADLFAAINVRYGAGDGSTTFAIPDYRNIFPMGAASLGATGERGGANSRALSGAELPAHAHSVNAFGTGTDSPDHTHTLPIYPQNVSKAPGGEGAAVLSSGAVSYGANARHTHTVPAHNTNNAGSGAAFDNRPAFAAVNFFIKT